MKSSFVFFGGEPISIPVLECLKTSGLTPKLIVCSQDKPVGRKHILTPPPIKMWATSENIPVWQPTDFSDREAVIARLKSFDLFIVVAYNYILPNWLITLPTYQTLNVHPSLLPKLRGASPIRSAILRDEPESVGVSIIVLDSKMDHGPIVAQEAFLTGDDWPLLGRDLDAQLAVRGGILLADTIPKWINNEIIPITQIHEQATYCSKFSTADGELTLDPQHLPTGQEARNIYLKIAAFDHNPGTFFIHKDTRIKINHAYLSSNGTLVISSVTPAGSKQQPFAVYLNSLITT